MTTQIRIDILRGASNVTKDDRERAEAAALRVLGAFEWRIGEPMEVDPAEAYAAYQRHVSDDEYNRSPRDTILIAAWEAAEKAAGRALTEGWYNPDGASCAIAV